MRHARIVTSFVWACTAIGVSITLIGCPDLIKASGDAVASVAVTSHSYKGTASVGDFITFDLDTSALTFSYHNVTNGLSGSGTYVVNTDGSYFISESSGCFTDAYEIPGYALVLKGTRTGPTQDITSLVTSFKSQTNTIASVANKSYNYMQFRINSGGLEVGNVTLGAAAQITTSHYWPYGNFSDPMNPSNAYQVDSTFPGSPTEDAATGALYLAIDDNGTMTDNYIFSTTDGLLAVDTGNGSLVCLEDAASSTLSTSNAGTYRGLSYGKTGANTGMGNIETPTVGMVGKTTVSVAADGTLLITDAFNATIASGTITPIAGSALQTNIGHACPGLFHASISISGVTQEVFVTFTGDAMLFSSFRPTSLGSSTYDYFYGVALKQVAASG